MDRQGIPGKYFFLKGCLKALESNPKQWRLKGMKETADGMGAPGWPRAKGEFPRSSWHPPLLLCPRPMHQLLPLNRETIHNPFVPMWPESNQHLSQPISPREPASPWGSGVDKPLISPPSCGVFPWQPCIIPGGCASRILVLLFPLQQQHLCSLFLSQPHNCRFSPSLSF